MFGQRLVWNLFDRTTWCDLKEEASVGYIAPHNRTTTVEEEEEKEEEERQQIKRNEDEAHHRTAKMLTNQNTTITSVTRKIMAQTRKWRRSAAQSAQSAKRIQPGNHHPLGGETLSPKIQFSVTKETARLPKWEKRKPKRTSTLSEGWDGKVGRQTTSVWMQLKTSTVVHVPKDRKKWMHQSHTRRIDEDEQRGSK